MQQWNTISVRGTGFAPSKKEILVLPPDVTPENLDEFLAKAEHPVAEFAIQAMLNGYEELED